MSFPATISFEYKYTYGLIGWLIDDSLFACLFAACFMFLDSLLACSKYLRWPLDIFRIINDQLQII